MILALLHTNSVPQPKQAEKIKKGQIFKKCQVIIVREIQGTLTLLLQQKGICFHFLNCSMTSEHRPPKTVDFLMCLLYCLSYSRGPPKFLPLPPVTVGKIYALDNMGLILVWELLYHCYLCMIELYSNSRIYPHESSLNQHWSKNLWLLYLKIL